MTIHSITSSALFTVTLSKSIATINLRLSEVYGEDATAMHTLTTEMRRIEVFADRITNLCAATDEDDCSALCAQLEIIVVLLSNSSIQYTKWYALDTILFAMSQCTGAFAQN